MVQELRVNRTVLGSRFPLANDDAGALYFLYKWVSVGELLRGEGVRLDGNKLLLADSRTD